jgi:hypothetical protein
VPSIPTLPEHITNVNSRIKVRFRGEVTGDSTNLIFSPDVLVEVVKRKCLEKLPNMYQLMYEGEELEDGNTMSSYGLKYGSEIEVLEYALKNVSKSSGFSICLLIYSSFFEMRPRQL